MSISAKEILTIPIEEELQKSYLDYAMSVIIGRALPDVRDGLKPVHRRVLYAMRELGNDWNKAYKKSARIVGDVIGKYHPHGDTAVYDAIVRLVQNFSMRYPLVDGQGNFGSVDGDAPAAMRYTEIRLAKISHYLLSDLDKDTVDFSPNYDETEFVPSILPTRVPNLLVNGSSGIAVGMATNIPPHNLGEVVDACLALIANPQITIDELLSYIPGPDFPTAAIINGRAGIFDAYRTGRGRVIIRSKVNIETDEDNGKQTIIVEELPYQVNKAKLLEKIGQLVKEKRLEGITAIRDESDKQGMRVVIELRRGENVEVMLNNLFSNTQMETTFGVNIVALVNGKPETLNLKRLLEEFVLHRREVVTRRTIYELKQAKARAHILEGLGIALTNIDAIVALIKQAKTPAIAKAKLLELTWRPGIVKTMAEQGGSEVVAQLVAETKFGLIDNDNYRLTEVQAQAILELRLQRLTALEQDKIFAEYKEILVNIQRLLSILHDETLLLNIIRDELLEIKNEFADSRRTQIIEAQQDLTREDLITPEDVIVTVSHEGYAKTQTVDTYQAQRRGGKGKIATSVKEEDSIEHLVLANTHDTILCFSNYGKVYWLKVYLVPFGSRTSRGRPLINLLPLGKEEYITAILPVKEYKHDQYVFMATASGIVKKVALKDFSNPRSKGIIALDLLEDDCLIAAALTDGDKDIMLFTDAGKVVRFNEQQVRSMGRTAKGVRGIKLKATQKVVSLVIVQEHGAILTATENGYGKRTIIDDYSIVNRGAQGNISIKVNERNGKVIAAIQVADEDEVMLISDHGILVRIRADEISIIGRNTQGVRLINLKESEKLIGMQVV